MSRAFWTYYRARVVGEEVGEAIGCLAPLIKKIVYAGLALLSFYGVVNPRAMSENLAQQILSFVFAIIPVIAFLVFATLLLKMTRGNSRYVFRALWMSFAQSWYPRLALVAWIVVWFLYVRPVDGNIFGSVNVIVQLCLLAFIGLYASLQFRADDVRIDRIMSTFRAVLGFAPEVFLGKSMSKVIYAVELPHHVQLSQNDALMTKIKSKFPKYKVTRSDDNVIWLELTVTNHFAPIWKITKLGAVRAQGNRGNKGARPHPDGIEANEG